MRTELYGPITLAFGQHVVPGNQLLPWPDRGTRVPANAELRSEGMQLILSVSRQAKQRRRRSRPAIEEPTPIAQFIHVHSHGILHSVTLPMAKAPPRTDKRSRLLPVTPEHPHPVPPLAGEQQLPAELPWALLVPAVDASARIAD
jgi:hypothetical protein